MLNLFSVAKPRGPTASNHVQDRDQIHDEGRQRSLGEQGPSGVGSTTTDSRHLHMAQSGKLGRNSIGDMRLAPSTAVPEHVPTSPKEREQGTLGAAGRPPPPPSWAPSSAKRFPFAKHVPGQECECCAKPQVMQQTLDELDFQRGIWWAAASGDCARLRGLVGERHRDVNEVDNGGYCALHYAARGGHVEACTILLDHGSNVDARTSEGAATPLMRACTAGHANVALLLLGRRASPTLCDNDGETPLHKAAKEGRAEVVKLLLELPGVSCGAVDNLGRRPVDVASGVEASRLLSSSHAGE